MKTITNEEGLTSHWSLCLGATLLIFYVGIVAINDIVFLVGGSVTGWSIPMSLVLALGVYSIFSLRHVLGKRLNQVAKRETVRHIRQYLVGLIILGLLLGISILMACTFYDLSWDGRDYHQRAISALAQGWNPVYEELKPTNVYYNIELNSYPKAQWIAAAAMYNLTGEIEAGKAFNLLLMAIVFLVSFAFLSDFQQVRAWQATLVSLALSVNPVSLNQSMNYYVDGQVSAVFILVLVLLLLSIRNSDPLVLITLGCSVVLGLNLKFTASAYVGLLCIAFVLIAWARRHSEKVRFKLMATLTISAIVGLFVVGFDPYVTNSMRYGHPLYPLYGDSQLKQQNLVGGQMPADFMSRSSLEKFLLSITLPPQNDPTTLQGVVSLFPPFDKYTLMVYSSPDVRINGWGPLYALLLVLGLVSIPLLFISSCRLGLTALGLNLLIVLVSLPNSELWWARYAPQFWLIPLVIAIACLISRWPTSRAWGTFVTLVALADLVLIGIPYFTINSERTTIMRTTLEELASNDQEILVYYKPFEATAIKLQQYGIRYRTVASLQELPCPQNLAPGVYYSLLVCSSSVSDPLFLLDTGDLRYNLQEYY